jgi:soluble lytic murein transglycosylase-like protein
MSAISVRLALGVMAGLMVAVPADADLVFFASGQTLSVRGHRPEADRVVLLLRGGGEIVCERRLIARVVPDEVPEPEPAGADAAAEIASADTVPFASIIDQLAAEWRVDPRLVRAVIQVESGYQPGARSPKGAMGLMQLMPATARQYAVQDPYEPRANIEAGVKHLRALLDRFDLATALAAYNAGEEAVRRFGGIPPYPETRSYVERVQRLLAVAGFR